MPQNYQAELVALFGSPVAENPTCLMQEAAFAVAGLNRRYLTIEVRPEKLAEALRGARAMGFRGLNFTIPHKVAVLPLLDEISPDAAMIGAVNTVRTDATSKFIGENTDGKGFLRGLRQMTDPRGKHIALLGAGGAARAIGVELALAGAASIAVYNRSADRGETMVRNLVDHAHARATFHPWKSTISVTPDVDILVNATSIGLFPDVEAMPDVSLEQAAKHLIVCDVIPNPPLTPLLKKARAKGLKSLDGLAMLVFQGVIGFEMWTGAKPSESAMRSALEAAFRV